MKQKIYRHGEIAFCQIDKIPDNLKRETANEFLKGSHGNPHTFDNGEFYPKRENEFIFGYFKAENTILQHIEHGEGRTGGLKVAKLPDGSYQLRRQNEIVNKELKQIID